MGGGFPIDAGARRTTTAGSARRAPRGGRTGSSSPASCARSATPTCPGNCAASRANRAFPEFPTRSPRRAPSCRPAWGTACPTIRTSAALSSGARGSAGPRRDAPGTVRPRSAAADRADGEVLVTAGAIGTPRLAMLSGIGPADRPGARDVEVLHNLPGVDGNLDDRCGIDIVAELDGPAGLDRCNRPRAMVRAAAQYALFSSGPFTSNVVEGGAFRFTDRALPAPDLQFHVLAGAGAEAGVPGVPGGASGIALNSCNPRPEGARFGPAARGRSGRPSRRRPRLPRRSRRSAHRDRRGRDHPRDLRPAVAAPARPEGALSRRQRARAGRLRGLCATLRPHLLPSRLHLQDGRWRDGRGRPPAAGAPNREPADLRQLDHARPDRQQHRRGHRHVRREGRGPDSRQPPRQGASGPSRRVSRSRARTAPGPCRRSGSPPRSWRRSRACRPTTA